MCVGAHELAVVYNAFPEELRAIRGYKKICVGAEKVRVFANKFYSSEDYFDVRVFLYPQSFQEILVICFAVFSVICFSLF